MSPHFLGTISVMPTPFTHLAYANQLLNDPILSDQHRLFLKNHLGAFLFGNFAPDGHAQYQGEPSLKREDSHFFEYRPKVDPPATQALLATYPQFQRQVTYNDELTAFIAGYLAHLAVDQIWCEQMLFPHFFFGEWGTKETRFTALHLIITVMDIRDYGRMPSDAYAAIQPIEPTYQLAFLPDTALSLWKNLVIDQFNPDGGVSQTYEILGKRVSLGADGLKAVIESPEALQIQLWDYVSPSLLKEVEVAMYQYMVQTVITYLETD